MQQKRTLLASNNQQKVERYKRLLAELEVSIELVTPSEYGIEALDVVEDGETLEANARLKAQAYAKIVDIPVLGNDTGFWLETEGFVDAPKRVALAGESEHELSKEEITKRMLAFWKQKATDNGGKVDAAWIDVFVLILPDRTERVAEARRDVVLTDTPFGEPLPQMPVRALYISKTTNKPSIQHIDAEELEEMQPVIDALRSVFV